MPARFKPNLSIVGPDLVFQIAVGYVDSIPVTDLVTLPLVIASINEASGGPGAVGTYPVYVSDTEMHWFEIAGQYLGDESGNQLLDQLGNILIG